MPESNMKTQIRLIMLQFNKFSLAKSIVELHDKSVRSKQVHEKFIEYLNELEVEVKYNISIPLKRLLTQLEFDNLPKEIQIKLIQLSMCPFCGGSLLYNDDGKKTVCGGCEYVF